MSEIKVDFSLNGKLSMVTGATGILGKDFCRALAQFGSNIVVIDRDQDQVERFASELAETYDVKALGKVCDVSSNEQTHSLVKEVEEEIGDIHILHNNAATKTDSLKSFLEDFENYSPITWDEIMGVNVGGMFNMCQAVGKHMCERKIAGSIIQTASIYGVVAPDQRIYEGSMYNGEKICSPAVYSVSKAGVLGLTKYLSAYWGEKGIRVNSLTPGGVESGQNEEFSRKYSARVPLGRMAKKGDMLGTLVFLASDASSYVTGQNIIVDGGLSVW